MKVSPNCAEVRWPYLHRPLLLDTHLYESSNNCRTYFEFVILCLRHDTDMFLLCLVKHTLNPLHIHYFTNLGINWNEQWLLLHNLRSVWTIPAFLLINTTGVHLKLEDEAHKVNPKIKSGPSLTLKSLKEVADSVKSLLVAEERAGGVNFMGYVLNWALQFSPWVD